VRRVESGRQRVRRSFRGAWPGKFDWAATKVW